MESLAPDLSQMRRTPLHDSHVEALRTVGREIVFEEGEVVIRPGDPIDTFHYVLEGDLRLVDDSTLEPYLSIGLGPKQFTGEISFLQGGVQRFTMRAFAMTRVLAVARDDLLRLMARIPEMSDIIMTVFAARRRRQLEEGDSALTIVGARIDRRIAHIANFAERNKIPFRELQVDTPEAEELAKRCGTKAGPMVTFGKDQLLNEPTPSSLARLLGLDRSAQDGSRYELIIVGAGPAGVAAAVYAGAEGLKALVIDELAVGGQAGTSSRIENYLGFPTGISGSDLVWRGEIQALKFGTQFAVPRTVRSIEKGLGAFSLELGDGTGDRATVHGRAILIATGVQYRRLPLDRLQDFEGAGIYYAATRSEGRVCEGRTVVIIGGGNSAGQAAMYLCRVAKHVHLVVRGVSLSQSMSDYLSTRLEDEQGITIHFETEVSDLWGDDRLERVTIEHRDGRTQRLDDCALFIMIGAAPNTGWLGDLVELDDRGFVLTGTGAGKKSEFETSTSGVYAVGDVRAGSVKRVASAVGEGSVVISTIWKAVRLDDS
ncbi:MAG: FAD-dependent oxidoreductase [Myxococcota bacterium]